MIGSIEETPPFEDTGFAKNQRVSLHPVVHGNGGAAPLARVDLDQPERFVAEVADDPIIFISRLGTESAPFLLTDVTCVEGSLDGALAIPSDEELDFLVAGVEESEESDLPILQFTHADPHFSLRIRRDPFVLAFKAAIKREVRYQDGSGEEEYNEKAVDRLEAPHNLSLCSIWFRSASHLTESLPLCRRSVVAAGIPGHCSDRIVRLAWTL